MICVLLLVCQMWQIRLWYCISLPWGDKAFLQKQLITTCFKMISFIIDFLLSEQSSLRKTVKITAFPLGVWIFFLHVSWGDNYFFVFYFFPLANFWRCSHFLIVLRKRKIQSSLSIPILATSGSISCYSHVSQNSGTPMRLSQTVHLISAVIFFPPS